MQQTKQLNKEDIRKNKPSRVEYLTQSKLPITLVLDNVTSSFNIGSCIRLADAFSIEKVIICGQSQSTISVKTLRKSSRNVDKWVCIEYSNNSALSLQTLLDQKYTVFSVELCHQSTDYKHVTYTIPCALVLGNERHGVSETILNLSHQQVHIPMFGMGNSMNVSTAGAIVLAECANQQRRTLQKLNNE